MKRYYVDGPDGTDYYETAEQAEQAAESLLDEAREEAGDSGWPEWIDSLEWGEVVCHQYAVQTSREPAPRKGVTSRKFGSTGFVRIGEAQKPTRSGKNLRTSQQN